MSIPLWLVGFTLSMKAMLMAELSAAGKLEKYTVMEGPVGERGVDGVAVYYGGSSLKRFIADLSIPGGILPVIAIASTMDRYVADTFRERHCDLDIPWQCVVNDGPEIVVRFLQDHPRARIVVLPSVHLSLAELANVL